jgi:hypothetical protein
LTLASAAGRGFLVERFGAEGLKIASSLLEEMGVRTSQGQEDRQKPAS